MEKVIFELDGVRHQLVDDEESVYSLSPCDDCSIHYLCESGCTLCIADYFKPSSHFELVELV